MIPNYYMLLYVIFGNDVWSPKLVLGVTTLPNMMYHCLTYDWKRNCTYGICPFCIYDILFFHWTCRTQTWWWEQFERHTIHVWCKTNFENKYLSKIGLGSIPMFLKNFLKNFLKILPRFSWNFKPILSETPNTFQIEFEKCQK